MFISLFSIVRSGCCEIYASYSWLFDEKTNKVILSFIEQVLAKIQHFKKPLST